MVAIDDNLDIATAQDQLASQFTEILEDAVVGDDLELQTRAVVAETGKGLTMKLYEKSGFAEVTIFFGSITILKWIANRK